MGYDYIGLGHLSFALRILTKLPRLKIHDWIWIWGHGYGIGLILTHLVHSVLLYSHIFLSWGLYLWTREKVGREVRSTIRDKGDAV